MKWPGFTSVYSPDQDPPEIVLRTGTHENARRLHQCIADAVTAETAADTAPAAVQQGEKAPAVPLTDEQINKVWQDHTRARALPDYREYAREILAAAHGIGCGGAKDWQQIFEAHTHAVADFLNELYAIMVDPLADGTLAVAEVKQALLAAALRDREAAHGIGSASTSEPAPQAVQAQALEVRMLTLDEMKDAAAWAMANDESAWETLLLLRFARVNAGKTIRSDCKVAWAHASTAASASDAAKQQDSGSVHLVSPVPSEDLQAALADTPTPPPQAGTWTLVAPDGRTWTGDGPLRACAAEQRDRIPADVALARIYRAAAEPESPHPEQDRKLLEQALEAMEAVHTGEWPDNMVPNAIAALRVRLGKEKPNGN